MRHTIEIQRNTPTVNAVGESTDVWATVARVPASIEPLVGSEVLFAQQIIAVSSAVIEIRYTPQVIPEARLKFGSRLFDINGIANIEERNRKLVLAVKELK
jgi:SPP1 family predicted phage head-tail adaptor